MVLHALRLAASTHWTRQLHMKSGGDTESMGHGINKSASTKFSSIRPVKRVISGSRCRGGTLQRPEKQALAVARSYDWKKGSCEPGLWLPRNDVATAIGLREWTEALRGRVRFCRRRYGVHVGRCRLKRDRNPWLGRGAAGGC